MDGAAWSMAATPDSPDTPAVTTRGWAATPGDAEAIVHQLRSLLADGYRVVVAAEGEGSAANLSRILADHGLDLAFDAGRDEPLTRPGGQRRTEGPTSPEGSVGSSWHRSTTRRSFPRRGWRC